MAILLRCEVKGSRIGISLPVSFEQIRHSHLTPTMNALKKSLRTLVTLITLLVCLSSIQGAAQVSKEKVMRWHKAAKKGDSKAQNILASRYYNGKGVPQDYAEAMKWWRLAAEQGDAEAQHGLGDCYYGGKGVPKDYAEAVKWWRLAAEQRDATAQMCLGGCYYNGKGVPQDEVLAYMWYNLAAASGFEAAKSLRELISVTMTPEQIAEAQKLSREWKPKSQ